MTKSTRTKLRPWITVVILLGAALSLGHVNSPHVFLEEQVGPYPSVILLHMPPAIPGEAELQVRLQDRLADEVATVLVREIPPQGETHAPEWYSAQPSAVDPSFFTAPIPLMVHGLWRIEVTIRGPRGEGTTTFPVPARVARPRSMAILLSGALVGLILILVVTLVQIMQGLGQDAHRPEVAPPEPRDRRRGLRFAVAGLLGFTLFFGFIAKAWYDFDEMTRFAAARSLDCELVVENPPAVAGKPLQLRMTVLGRNRQPLRRLISDHGKMMHVVVVDRPGASRFFHLHPGDFAPGDFRFRFTPPAEGSYELFGDLLLDSGEVDTVTTSLEVGPGAEPPEIDLENDDDSYAFGTPAEAVSTGNSTSEVGDGLVIRWASGSVPALRTGEFHTLEFELVDAAGKPVDGIETYAGSAGQLVLLSHDFEVFSRVKPAGGIASFPYGFPRAGRYRLWVQMKRDGRVHTGVFDVQVD